MILKRLATAAAALTLLQMYSAQAEIRGVPRPLIHDGSKQKYQDIELYAEIYESKLEWVEEYRQWEEWDCDYEAPDRPENWNSFFTVPYARKAQALADSVQGIDLSLARSIVDSHSNFFSIRPSTWNGFKQEIARIERELPARGLYYEVILVNGAENMRKLGYEYSNNIRGLKASDGDFNNPGSGSDQGGRRNDGDFNNPGSGGDQNHRRDGDFNPPSNGRQVHCEKVYKSGVIYYKKEVERKTDTLTKRVDVYIENSQLLPGETEKIVLKWDGKSERADVDDSNALNKYGVAWDSRGFVITLKGEARKAVRPALEDFSASFGKDGSGKLILNFNDSRATQLGNSYNLKVNFQVTKHKGGLCPKDAVVGSKTVSVSNGAGPIVLNDYMSEAPVAGTKYSLVNVTFEREGSNYFSGTTSPADLGTLKN